MVRRVFDYLATLKFPQLLAFTVLLFVFDLFIPDFIPFADEVLLGGVSLLLGRLKKGSDSPG